jgi:hypothetical protein
MMKLIAKGNTAQTMSAHDIKILMEAMTPTSGAPANPTDGLSSTSQTLTQTLLALIVLSLIGFALGVLLVSSSTDAGDLRKTIITALLSLLATIAGFYFGARTAQQSAAQATGTSPTFSHPSPPVTGTVNQPYTYSFVASGSPTPTYQLAPGAPTWLTIDPITGTVSGTPTESGPQTFSVTATNSAGSATAGPFTVTVV